MIHDPCMVLNLPVSQHSDGGGVGGVGEPLLPAGNNLSSGTELNDANNIRIYNR